MLSAIQPQSLASIVLKRSIQSQAELCLDPDPVLSITPVQIVLLVQHVVQEIQTTTAVPMTVWLHKLLALM